MLLLDTNPSIFWKVVDFHNTEEISIFCYKCATPTPLPVKELCLCRRHAPSRSRHTLQERPAFARAEAQLPPTSPLAGTQAVRPRGSRGLAAWGPADRRPKPGPAPLATFPPEEGHGGARVGAEGAGGTAAGRARLPSFSNRPGLPGPQQPPR